MKTKILFLSLLVTVGAYAQEKINGIGVLKVGMTVEEMKTEMQKKGFTINTCSNFATCLGMPFSKNKVVNEVKNYSKISTNISGKYVPVKTEGITDFFVQNYEIAGITMPNFLVRFYHDKLAYIEIKNMGSKLKDKLTLKYGEPETEKETKQIECSYINKKSEKEEIKYTSYFRNDEDVVAVYTTWFHYNKMCQPIDSQSFIIYNPTAYEVFKDPQQQRNEETEKDDLDEL